LFTQIKKKKKKKTIKKSAKNGNWYNVQTKNSKQDIPKVPARREQK